MSCITRAAQVSVGSILASQKCMYGGLPRGSYTVVTGVATSLCKELKVGYTHGEHRKERRSLSQRPGSCPLRQVSVATCQPWGSVICTDGMRRNHGGDREGARWRCEAQAEDAVAAEVDAPEDDIAECEVVLGKELQLGTGEEQFGCHLAQAVKNRNGSGVLLLTDILGYQNGETRDFAYRLACFGYSVLVPDLFRGIPWDSSRPQSEYESWRQEHDPERVAADIATAGEYLRTHVVNDKAAPGDGRMAVLGFCFGGGRLIETLAHDESSHQYSTGVFFYGTRFNPDLAAKIKAPLLLIAGDDDELCTVDTVKLLEGHVAGSQAMVFPGRGHAFAHHPKSMDDDDDAELAFNAAKQWLNEHLLGNAPGPWAEDTP